MAVLCTLPERSSPVTQDDGMSSHLTMGQSSGPTKSSNIGLLNLDQEIEFGSSSTNSLVT
jgi:hypothetical protein